VYKLVVEAEEDSPMLMLACRGSLLVAKVFMIFPS
jgi:hypothetical protein